MNRLSGSVAVALLLAAACAQAQDAAAPKSKRAAAASWSEDGLQKVDIKGLDVVYVRPEATLADYKRVLLRPISIEFRRHWGTSNSSSLTGRVPAEDMKRIKERLGGVVREEVLKELAAGGYAAVDAADADVLDVELAITDLYIAAPDVKQPGRMDIYALSAGEMTLVANLRDSPSGETLARIYDHDIATEHGMAHRITLGENEAEARKMAKEWAKILRRELDLARAK